MIGRRIGHWCCRHVGNAAVSSRRRVNVPRRFLTSESTVQDVSEETAALHISAMCESVIDILKPQNQQVFVDMTFGAGGHTKRILEVAPLCKIYCLDRDPQAYKLAKELSEKTPQVVPLNGKFSEIHRLLHAHGIGPSSVDGILFDCGTSFMQFDTPHRGFSISRQANLDMRMDGSRYPDQVSAYDVVNYMSESGLYHILQKYGEEKAARVIARGIVDTRNAFGHIQTTSQLADVIYVATGFKGRKDKLQRHSHSATKTFQAIRIFVNNELNEIHNGLEIAWHLLKPGGICAAITFHSLEDRIVKRLFHGIDIDAKINMSHKEYIRRQLSQEEMETILHKKWEVLSKKITSADKEEVASNPRVRSAKLRAARKVVKDVETCDT